MKPRSLLRGFAFYCFASLLKCLVGDGILRPKTKEIAQMKILDSKIGEYLYEKGFGDEPFTAGRIVAMVECTVKRGTVYILLRSDAGEYTIYSTLSSCHCTPRLARFIPSDSMIELAEAIVADGTASVSVGRKSKAKPAPEPEPEPELVPEPEVQKPIEDIKEKPEVSSFGIFDLVLGGGGK
jgi:hypothetical protein